MTIEVGGRAVAIWTPEGWALKGVVEADGASTGVAIWTGEDWVFAPASGELESGDRALCINGPDGEAVVVPMENGSGSGTGGVPGGDLCGTCSDDDVLYEEYEVTISGMPSTFFCDLSMCNGTWTVSWSHDCTWVCAIDDWTQITLWQDAGGLWKVTASLSAPGGCSRELLCDDCSGCDPTGSYSGSGSAAVVTTT